MSNTISASDNIGVM